jgi:hypothetical protein
VENAPQRVVHSEIPARDGAELEKLAWLSGTWVVHNGGKTTEEHRRSLSPVVLFKKQ